MVCGILIVQFFLLALLAVRQKNATYDENFHVLGAYSNLWLNDYRVDFDNFTWWSYWAALPQGPSGVKINRFNPHWQELVNFNIDIRDKWTMATLYHTPGNDVDAILNRSRVMMLLVGCALAGLAARWSYELGGSIAAIFATILLTFDPNFLGHSPLVKNDVSAALVVVAAAYAAFRMVRRITVWNLLGLIIACAASANVKASVIIVGPLVILALAVRAILPVDWIVLGKALYKQSHRLAAVAACAILCAISGYTLIWASYGFRFATTTDSANPMSIERYAFEDRFRHYYTTHGSLMALDLPESAWPTSRGIALAVWAEKHHLFPQPWLCGFVYASAELRYRPMFLRGERSLYGWWYYFPLASLYKLPMATIATLAALPLILLSVVVRRWWRSQLRFRQVPTDWLLPAVCVFGIAGAMLAMSMISHVNLGVRHIFPVYALVYIGLGWAAAVAWRRWIWLTRPLPILLALVLMIESYAAYPNYIAFFNRAAGGARGGINLLSDANLDWGQDLKLVAQWAREHPDVPMYLCYQSLADPHYYKLDYSPVFSGYHNEEGLPVTRPGILAIDANSLQAVFSDDTFREMMQHVRTAEPVEVLGGTFYLYRVK